MAGRTDGVPDSSDAGARSAFRPPSLLGATPSPVGAPSAFMPPSPLGFLAGSHAAKERPAATPAMTTRPRPTPSSTATPARPSTPRMPPTSRPTLSTLTASPPHSTFQASPSVPTSMLSFRSSFRPPSPLSGMGSSFMPPTLRPRSALYTPGGSSVKEGSTEAAPPTPQLPCELSDDDFLTGDEPKTSNSTKDEIFQCTTSAGARSAWPSRWPGTHGRGRRHWNSIDVIPWADAAVATRTRTLMCDLLGHSLWSDAVFAEGARGPGW